MLDRVASRLGLRYIHCKRLSKIIQMEKNKVFCPSCENEIDVNALIYHQIEEEIKLKTEEDKKKIKNEALELEKEKEAFEKNRQKEQELFEERLAAKVAAEKIVIESNLKLKLEREKSREIELLQKELNQRSEQENELNRTKAEVFKLQREKEEIQFKVEANGEAKVNQKLAEEREKIKKIEEQKSEFKIKELRIQLDAQKELTLEMQRKQEQGSVQLQGEVQELVIEEYLVKSFPLDYIKEVKKGARGADCLQTVNTRERSNCGSIYYESKRAKDFGSNWIQKFKDDMTEAGANIGILVSDARPAGTERMCLRDGVWVCSYEEFKGLCCVIREHLIAIDCIITSQENKGGKMEILYEFLTSNEFRLQIEGIIEGYSEMQKDLNVEKRAITGHWKKREKQLTKVLRNTTFMYNSLRGLAGNAIQTVSALEFAKSLADFQEVDESVLIIDEE